MTQQNDNQGAIPWRCGDLAADGHVTVVNGRPGQGKSLLSLALANAVQTGGAVAGIACAKGRVVILDGDSNRWIFSARVHEHGISTADLDYVAGGGLDLVRHRSWITDQCRGAQLVIFDSIRTLAPGAKENDHDDMAPVMSAIRHVARKTGAAAVAIHHSGKAEADFRGSSVICEQADLMFVVERAPRDPDRSRRVLRPMKSRIAEVPPTRWISLGAGEVIKAAPFDAPRGGDEG